MKLVTVTSFFWDAQDSECALQESDSWNSPDYLQKLPTSIIQNFDNAKLRLLADVL
jgi:hypothetical protein